jgi:hypothetical protein
VFTKCPTYPEAHGYLNSIYSTTLPDHLRIYDDPEAHKDVKANIQLLDTFRSILADECIGPDALDTDDKSVIRPLINRCTLSVNVGNQFPTRRLTKTNLEAAFDFAISNNRIHDIRLSIGIHGLHFRPGLNYLNWGIDIVDDPSGFGPAPPGMPSAAPDAAAPSATDIATAVASAVASAIASAPAPAVTLTTPTTTSTTRMRMLFNPSSLPGDVRTRYLDKQARKLLTNVIYTPFNCPNDPCHGMHYWIDPAMEMTVYGDGSVFFHVPIDEKLVMKNPVPCKKDTHAGIRRWYQTFQETMMQYGVYVHPLWLFRKNHGGEWGFTIGNTNLDDVPSPLRMTCTQSSTIIYQLLSQSSMFPTGSRLHDCVASCFGNGLKALKTILQQSHPAFVDEPHTLVMSYPKQKDLTLLEYNIIFDDFAQMRSIVTGHSKDLNDSGELDVFIKNMKYRDFVNRVTRDERRQRALHYKYKGDELLETLNSVLMMSDSPALAEYRTQRSPQVPMRASTPGNATRRSPRNAARSARVNQIGAINPNVSNGISSNVDATGTGSGEGNSFERTNSHEQLGADAIPGDDSPQPFTNYDDACINLMQIEIPDNEEIAGNLLAFDSHRRAIHAIREDPNVAYEQRCIVCRGQHRFEQCDTLNDHNFLKQHCIRFCQNVRRDQAELNRQRNEPVNFMDQHVHEEESESDEDDDAHFRHGRH